jgi:hypothetical protein
VEEALGSVESELKNFHRLSLMPLFDVCLFTFSRLVTFVSNSNSQAQSSGSSENAGLPASSVYVSGVVTEPDLIQR